MFYPLYPVGIGAEWWLLYRAAEPAGSINRLIPPFFYFCLALYVPGKWGERYPRKEGEVRGLLTCNVGSYTMYTYMMKQRSKTLKSAKKSV